MDADLAAPTNDGAWQTFNAKVKCPQAGYYEVWAKATDDQGVSQPLPSHGIRKVTSTTLSTASH
ncbi:hypothetical protein P4S59_19645 [Vibrio sp. M60_M70]|jgi:hypothetical protein